MPIGAREPSSPMCPNHDLEPLIRRQNVRTAQGMGRRVKKSHDKGASPMTCPPRSDVHKVSSTPAPHCEYVEHPRAASGVLGGGVQPSISAHLSNVAVAPRRLAPRSGRPGTVLAPPLKGTMVSSVSRNEISATGRDGWQARSE